MWNKTCKNCYYNKYPSEGYLKCMHCILSPDNMVGSLKFKPIEEEKEMKKYEVTTTMNIYKTYNIEAENMEEARRRGEHAFTRLCKEGIGKECGDYKINFGGLRSVTEEIEPKPLILLCGKSGSGKTTIANILTEKYDLKQLESYTTRPKRSEDEKGHIFVSEDVLIRGEFTGSYYMCESNRPIPIMKTISGYKYWCTKDQLEEADIYVIDPKTVKEVVDYIDGERPILIIWVEVPEWLRTWRMVYRGDGFENIKQRFENERNWSIEDLTSLESKKVLFISIVNNENNQPYELADTIKYYYNRPIWAGM